MDNIDTDQPKMTPNKSDIKVDPPEIALTLIGMRDKYLYNKYLYNINSGVNYLILRGIDGFVVGG